MSDRSTQASPLDRLPHGLRLALLLATATLAMVGAAFVVGFLTAYVDEGGGEFSSRGGAVLAASLFATGLLSFLAWRLSAHWRRPGRGAFARRYTRMWVILLGLGLPVGMFLGVISDQDSASAGDLFSNGPIESWLAVVASVLLLLLFAVTMLLYHRTIDAHEEHAYLWASTGGYYFLAAALPTAWLLERGGLIGPLGLGSAMILLLASCAVQCLIWAWLKFR